jgi:flagellar protein FliJ
MTRTKKLAPVVDHVEKNERTALQSVAFSQQQLQQQLNRLNQLIEYQKEYAERHNQGAAISYTSVQLQEFNRFVHQLDETIKQQRHVVALAEREVEVKRQKWKLTHSRSNAIHKMVDRIQLDEEKQEQKKEQRSMDEISLRNAFRNS